MNGASLLEIRELSVSLGRQEILGDISFDLMRGNIHAVIGPNGAGKTTLFRALLGGVPHQGTIRFLFRHSAVIGYVPQLLEFDHSVPMTVSDFLVVMLQSRAAPLGRSRRVRQLTQHLLDMVGAQHLEKRTLSTLSGGESQRVVLAQALYPVPELLLLDEPASHVDELGTRHLHKLLRRFCEEQQLSVLMVGHDISSILELCDWVTAINRRIVFDGYPSEFSSHSFLGAVTEGRPDLPSSPRMPIHDKI